MYERLRARMTGLQHGLCLMLVTCFVLRALVAPGYMPSIAAGPSKPLKLVICTAQGLKAISVATSAPPDGHEGPPASDCAFAGLIEVAHLTHPDVSLGDIVAPSRPAAFAVVPPQTPVRRTGPLMGSRGPPATG